jgi:hypothetical protein
MQPLEKAAYIAIITVLLIDEIDAIKKNDLAVSAERVEQQSKLKALNDKATATLNAVDKTLRQTQPRAAIRFDRFEFQNAPVKIEANINYGFNWEFINNGSQTAQNPRVLARVYVGKADDKRAQIRLERQFEKEWKSSTIANHLGNLTPGYSPSFGSTHKTFDAKEIEELGDDGTIYLFVRFVYSDDVGVLGTDACSSFQRNGGNIDLGVLHSCQVFESFRYPIK